MALFARNFVEILVVALTLLIFARVILSWTDPTRRSSLSAFVMAATEPILAPVRRLLPRTGVLDLSPMIVLIVLSFLLSAIR